MSDAGADRVDARLTGLENTVEQMDIRLGEVHDRIDRLDDRMGNRFDTLESQIGRNRDEIRHSRTEMRREMLVIAAVVTALLGGLQLLVAWGVV